MRRVAICCFFILGAEVGHAGSKDAHPLGRRGLVGNRWPGRMRVGVEITGSRYTCPPHAHHSPPPSVRRCDLARWRRATRTGQEGRA